MNTPAKLLGFLVAAAAVFGLAIVVGRAVGPIENEPTPAHDGAHAADQTGDEHGEVHDPKAETASQTQIPGGLMAAQDGYALTLTDANTEAGENVPVTFTITGPDGSPVTDYTVEHEKELHLIAVRRDFTGFQHVHPVLDEDGVWTTELDLTPGSWRVFADFKAAGAAALTLGTDLAVSGDYEPAELSDETRTATVDEYEVTLDGDPTAGTDAKLTLSVTRNGKPVTDLQPYLGAYGHLVALRSGDLAYLHVHPDGTPGDGTTEPGPDVVFYAAVPSSGIYHLYLDFKHQGTVRTAAFTVNVGADGGDPTEADPSDDGSSHEQSGGHAGH